ncbi:MAG: Clp protease N-terminal domain-containing protein, partial [Asticcacaulis sp.]
MNPEKYTEKTQKTIQSAQAIAQSRNHQYLTPLHILKALTEDRDAIARHLIERAGGRTEAFTGAVDTALSKLPSVQGEGQQLYMHNDTARLFTEAENEANKQGDAFVTADRLLVAALNNTEGANMLKAAGISLGKLKEAQTEFRKGKPANSSNAESGFDALNKYARDLTQD